MPTTFSTNACLGADESACRASLADRVDANSVTLCLAVGDQTGAVDLDAEPLGSVPVDLAVTRGSGLDAALFWLQGSPCDDQWTPTAVCTAAAGCVFALGVTGAVVPARGAFNIDFGLSGCAPAWGEDAPTETCDGADEDCDGSPDETFGVGDSCSEVECAGVIRCDDAGGVLCALEPVPDRPELANGLDDDCDGNVDEAIGPCVPGDMSPCGDGVGVCELGMSICQEGADGRFEPGPCLDLEGNPVIRRGERGERCDGVDNDCDGVVDNGIGLGAEGIPVGDPCPPVPGCTAPGRVECRDGVPECIMQGTPEEICNDQDDDCDGQADEDFELLGQACTDGVGACEQSGLYQCVADGEVACSAQAGDGGDERCDSIDNDCNGSVDEGFGLGEPCATAPGICAQVGVTVCDLDTGRAACEGEVGPAEPEICNDADDDCDAAIDEDFDLQRDPENCGACGAPCAPANATGDCVGGACTIGLCDAGSEDRDGDAANGCECTPDALDLPDVGFIDRDCDGIDGDLEGGVFVDPGGDDANVGSALAPVQTLGRALEVLNGNQGQLYLAAGEHGVAETLQVPNGVHLFGGYRFDPDAGTWSRGGLDTHLTVITGASPVLLYDTLDARTILANVEVRAVAAPAGEASVAVVALATEDHLRLEGARLIAADGSAGAAGTAGQAGEGDAEQGAPGLAGNFADCRGCGGPGGSHPGCEGDARDPAGATGGLGGGLTTEEMDRAPTSGAASAGGQLGGGGGPGNAQAPEGNPGGRGGLGAAGQSGAAGVANGRVVLRGVALVWQPLSGADGLPGRPGNGGGGGGGGIASPDQPGTTGGGGGGGGAGGCGGSPGLGGGGGSGSVGLLVRGGIVRLLNTTIAAGAGGDGGAGGGGGVGAAGAAGGPGGVVDVDCEGCGVGGEGGPGSSGGCGGPGGSGGGGPSIAVLRVADAEDALAAVGVVLVDRQGQVLADQGGLVAALLPGVVGAAGPGVDPDLPCLDRQAGSAGHALPQACCVAAVDGLCGGLDTCP